MGSEVSYDVDIKKALGNLAGLFGMSQCADCQGSAGCVQGLEIYGMDGNAALIERCVQTWVPRNLEGGRGLGFRV